MKFNFKKLLKKAVKILGPILVGEITRRVTKEVEKRLPEPTEPPAP